MNHTWIPILLAACDAASTPAGATQQIVYMAPVKAGFEIVIMNLDGSSRVQITDNDVQEFLPHFSPDATKVIYTKFKTGGYGLPSSRSVVAVTDIATLTEIELTADNELQPVWSPDGSRVAFLSMRDGTDLWVMNADGSDQHEIGGPAGTIDDQVWGDIAWSSDDWIMFVVAQQVGGPCFKVRIDKIRPDGTNRTQVTAGGPSCTPIGMEQSGDADPGFSADGKTIYSSRGLPKAPAGSAPPNTTERQLYAFSSDAWTPGKVETSLALASEPDCIEGVPKGSPDGTRILEFRACFYQPNQPNGVTLTDTTGSYRAFIAEGFGPDWNPIARN